MPADECHGRNAGLEAIREMFRASGVRYTRKRACVYEALASTTSHPTAQELHGFVRRVERGLSLATVYNTLELLSEHGLCRRIPGPTPSSPSRYDADIGPHVHVVTDDGRVMDVPMDLSVQLLGGIPSAALEALGERLGIDVTGVDLKLVGRSRAKAES